MDAEQAKNKILFLCEGNEKLADEFALILLEAYFKGWQEGIEEASKMQEQAHLLFFGEGGNA
jgi:hypothetical protein